MRAIQSGKLGVDAEPVKHLDLCLGCRACETACPSGVQYGTLLEETRDHIEKHHKRGVFQTVLRRWIIEKVFPYPWRTSFALLPVRVLRFLRLDGLIPGFAKSMLELVPHTWPSANWRPSAWPRAKPKEMSDSSRAA